MQSEYKKEGGKKVHFDQQKNPVIISPGFTSNHASLIPGFAIHSLNANQPAPLFSGSGNAVCTPGHLPAA
jgi:hypothetical protein